MTHIVQSLLTEARQHLVSTAMRITEAPKSVTLTRRAQWAVQVLNSEVCTQVKEIHVSQSSK